MRVHNITQYNKCLTLLITLYYNLSGNWKIITVKAAGKSEINQFEILCIRYLFSELELVFIVLHFIVLLRIIDIL